VDDLHIALNEAGTVLLHEQESRRRAELERQQLLASEQKARQLAEDQNKSKDAFSKNMLPAYESRSGQSTRGPGSAPLHQRTDSGRDEKRDIAAALPPLSLFNLLTEA
jgi:hypothetical protein